MTRESYYEYQLKNLDLDSLDSYEYIQFNNLIISYNKTESLKIIIGEVDKKFNQLSSNLKEIAEEYYG